jgi:hypothetical protein
MQQKPTEGFDVTDINAGRLIALSYLEDLETFLVARILFSSTNIRDTDVFDG